MTRWQLTVPPPGRTRAAGVSSNRGTCFDGGLFPGEEYPAASLKRRAALEQVGSGNMKRDPVAT